MNSKKIISINTPVVLIVCDLFRLNVSLIDKLTTYDLIIVVVSKNQKRIRERCERKNVIVIRDIEEFKKNFKRLDYLIYFKSPDKKYLSKKKNILKKLKKEILIYKNLVEKYKPKSLFLLHSVYNNNISEKIVIDFEKFIKVIESIGALVLYGDLVSFNNQSIFLSKLQDILIDSIFNKRIVINKRQIYFPLLEEDLSENIFNLLFSLKAYGKTFFIAGRPLKTDTLSKIIGNQKIKFNDKSDRYMIFNYDEKITLKKLSKILITDVYQSLKNNKQNYYLDSSMPYKANGKSSMIINNLNLLVKKRLFKVLISNLKGKIKKIFLFNKYKLFAVLISFIFLLPVFLSLTVMGLLFFTKIAFNRNLIDVSIGSAKTSFIISKSNYNYSFIFKKIPFIGNYFSVFIKPSYVLTLQSESAVQGVELFSNFSEMLKKIINKEEFDSDSFSRRLVFDLEIFYQKLGFLESEVTGNNNFAVSLVSYLINDINFASERQKILEIKNLTGKIPLLIGADKTVKYALIYQNNSNLRPTGGGIETLSIIVFSGSKIIEEATEDVSWFDKKLSGYVEPPEILKKHFGIDSWYLRDSNWDPDYPSSASQISFFLDKELDVSFNGLIAVDKDFIYKVLYILDNKNYTRANLDKFFDEKRNSENYPLNSSEYAFTTLLKNTISKPRLLSDRKSAGILKEIVTGLENRNIQIFVKDNEVQKSLSSLKWDGSFERIECLDDCYSDFVSLIESTKEGDGSGVVRDAQFSVFFQEGIVKRKLILYLENKNESIYKGYLRLFTNTDVGFSPVRLVALESTELIEPETRSAKGLKEAGVNFEIKPKQTLAIDISWEGVSTHNFEKKGEYRLYWRKQSGAEEHPIEITLNLPANVIVFTNPEYSLTERGILRYNTSLERDFHSRIFW